MKNHEEEQQQDYDHHQNQYNDERGNHITIGDSPPSTYSVSPHSFRSYKTPSPAGDFGPYSNHFSWAAEPEPMAQPNRSYPAEPLVVTKSLDPESHKKVDHFVESHDGDDEDRNDTESESEKERAVDGDERSGGGQGSFNRRKMRPELKKKKKTMTSMAARNSSHGVAKRALLGFRVCGFTFCLISFSVMATNRYQGWALDSFFI